MLPRILLPALHPAPGKPAARGQSWFSESLARGLLVLRAFSRERPRLRASEVAELTKLSRAAVRRHLMTLQSLGYVGVEDERFFLRPRILDIGYGYLSSAGIEELIEPILQEIAVTADGASHFAILDDWQVLFVASVPSRRMRNTFTVAGGRMPAYVGSLGPTLLAWLPGPVIKNYLRQTKRVRFTDTTVAGEAEILARLARVRANGYAVNRGEYTDGIVGVAIPLRNRQGQVIAALNINRFSPRPPRPEQIKSDLAILKEAAMQIEAALQTPAWIKRHGFAPFNAASDASVAAARSKSRSGQLSVPKV